MEAVCRKWFSPVVISLPPVALCAKAVSRTATAAFCVHFYSVIYLLARNYKGVSNVIYMILVVYLDCRIIVNIYCIERFKDEGVMW